MKILLIDNYDSFTYNLYQIMGELLMEDGSAFRLDVERNDSITASQIKRKKYDRIVISPGPGSPDDRAYFGVCAEVLTDIGRKTPVFGVCLGMQGMAHYFGGKVVRASQPMHGKTSTIVHDRSGVFSGLPQGIAVMRYHSLVVDPDTLPDCLAVTATVAAPTPVTEVETAIREIPYEQKNLEGVNPAMLLRTAKSGTAEIMGLRHTSFPVEGIQFHPESFATEGGKLMIRNFLFSPHAT
ncbi:MAG: aminodeoxychorismate/anthranilate synthase component II [Patescibacteria group bacterium]|nr:aminodeoxychorismate/anthranilate synthase component II [Patescibacteria group bacterium]